MFGLDPKNVLIHKEMHGRPISWRYGSIDYISLGKIEDITYEKICDFMKEYITDTGTTYAIIPVLADNEWRITNLEYISLSGQIIITNLVNPMELFNHLESSYKLVMTR